MSRDDFRVDFFCVGVAKAGTTTLHDLLNLQKDISLPDNKETNYFSFGMNGKPCFTGPLDSTSINETTITSLDDYINCFDHKDGSLVGEICPSYALKGTAKTLYQHNPEAKIIILLREPVSRAFSNYQHLVRDGREQSSFEDALAAESSRLESGWEWFWGLTQNSFYAEFVKDYLDVFGRENVRILYFEEFIKKQKEHLEEIYGFLGLDPAELVYQELSSNQSGVVSGRWSAVHRLLLAQGSFNSALRTILPTGLRKKLGQAFKSLSTVKGEIADETRSLLSQRFQSDLQLLSELVGKHVYQRESGRDVS